MISRHPWGGLADPALPLPSDVSILGLPLPPRVRECTLTPARPVPLFRI